MIYQFRENKKEERSIELKETGLVYKSIKSGEHEIPCSEVKKINLLMNFIIDLEIIPILNFHAAIHFYIILC